MLPLNSCMYQLSKWQEYLRLKHSSLPLCKGYMWSPQLSYNTLMDMPVVLLLVENNKNLQDILYKLMLLQENSSLLNKGSCLLLWWMGMQSQLDSLYMQIGYLLRRYLPHKLY